MCIYSRYIFACCLFCSRNAADTWRARCLYIYVYMSVYVDVWALAFVSLRGFRARVLSSAVLLKRAHGADVQVGMLRVRLGEGRLCTRVHEGIGPDGVHEFEFLMVLVGGIGLAKGMNKDGGS